MPVYRDTEYKKKGFKLLKVSLVLGISSASMTEIFLHFGKLAITREDVLSYNTREFHYF